jgi:hypothetical protein
MRKYNHISAMAKLFSIKIREGDNKIILSQ